LITPHDESLNVVLGLEFGAAGGPEQFYAGYEVGISGRGGPLPRNCGEIEHERGNLQVLYDSTGHLRVEAKIDAAYLKETVAQRIPIYLESLSYTKQKSKFWNFVKLLGRRGVKLFRETISKFDMAGHIELKNDADSFETGIKILASPYFASNGLLWRVPRPSRARNYKCGGVVRR
jgi:hypothetical protein